MDKTLIVLIGPTGVGKTELSLRIAERYGASIVSSDSRQIYRDLPIGTAAATEDQMQRVRHHFVGILGLDEYFSAARFEEETMSLLEGLFSDSDVQLMTGGSMMYVDAVCKGIDDMPSVCEEVRSKVYALYDEIGLEGMQQMLMELDPEYYEIVDRCNHKRVMHAIEICLTTGRTFTSFRTNCVKERPFRILKIGLNRERQELYDRINHRVDIMVEQGLIEEARRVYEYKDYNSLNTVGYKELFKYFEGEWTLEFALDKIRQNSRIYSRKQITWFKRDNDITWFNPEDEDQIMTYIETSLKDAQ